MPISRVKSSAQIRYAQTHRQTTNLSCSTEMNRPRGHWKSPLRSPNARLWTAADARKRTTTRQACRLGARRLCAERAVTSTKLQGALIGRRTMNLNTDRAARCFMRLTLLSKLRNLNPGTVHASEWLRLGTRSKTHLRKRLKSLSNHQHQSSCP